MPDGGAGVTLRFGQPPAGEVGAGLGHLVVGLARLSDDLHEQPGGGLARHVPRLDRAEVADRPFSGAAEGVGRVLGETQDPLAGELV